MATSGLSFLTFNIGNPSEQRASWERSCLSGGDRPPLFEGKLDPDLRERQRPRTGGWNVSRGDRAANWLRRAADRATPGRRAASCSR